MCEEYVVSEMFDSEIKREFVESLVENMQAYNTIKNIENFLLRCEEFEDIMMNGKELKDFSFDDVKLMLKWLQSSSTETLVIYSQYVKDYINFAKKNNYSKNTLDFNQLLTLDVLKECVNSVKHEGKYISYATYKEIVDTAEDYTSKCIVTLLWNQFSIEDIVTMTIDDLDFENETIKGRKFDYDTLKLVRRSHEEDRYTFSLKNPDRPIEREYIKSEHIIKPYSGAVGKKRIETPDCILKRDVNRKLKEITEYMGLKYVTPDSISKSGLLYELHQLGMEDKKRTYVADYIMNTYGYSVAPAYKIVKLFLEMYIPKVIEE